MRIKRLDVLGFKSFPERVQVHFPAGISAVVGPNGCGKSNIVDAIRWVMGEQSPKQLRGRNMEDILFNGAKSYSQSSMAEVTMVLSNENGHSSGGTLGPSEISITRRLYRSGDSEYLINKVPCRLKDITQFFMDTGMGTKAYAIIEQGRIGWLVDARPEERRSLIDEAAGVTRYKAQKREAERKIEATEQNMVHISTLMAETKRQINSLTRQASKAARYKEFKSELKTVDLALAALDLETLSGQHTAASSSKNELETVLTGLLAELDRTELELETARLSIVEEEKAAESKAEALYELQKEYTQLTEEDKYSGQQAEENRGRQSRLREEIADLAEQRQRQSAELEGLRSQVSSLRAAAEEKRASVGDLRASYADLKSEHDLAVGRRDEAGRRLSEIREHSARIDEVLAGHERMARSQTARQDEIRLEVEQIEAERVRLDENTRTLLSEKAERTARIEDSRARIAVLREELAVGRSQVERLASEERRVDSDLAGLRSKLATLKEVQANFGWYPEGVQALMASAEMRAAGVIGPVAEKLNVPEGYEIATEAALGERLKYILVQDRPAAKRALEYLRAEGLGRCGFIALAALPSGAEADLTRALLGNYALVDDIGQVNGQHEGRSVLTRTGDYLGSDGVIVGGEAKGTDKGLLARLKEIDELESRGQALDDEMRRLAAQAREAAERVERTTEDLTAAEEATRAVQATLVEVDTQLSVQTGREDELEGRLDKARGSLDGVTAEANRLEEETESARVRKESLESDEFELTSTLEAAEEAAADLAERLEAAREVGQQASMEMSSITERLQNLERETSRTAEWLSQIENQSVRKDEELAGAEAELERLQDRRRSLTEKLDGFAERLRAAETDTAEQRRRVDAILAAANEKENEARAARRRRSELDDQVRKVDLDLQETGFRRQALLERIENEYRLDLANLSEADRPEIGPDFDREEATSRRDALRAKIDGMGEVNLTAINEHDALLERYEFYKSQYDDLTGAIANLRDSINRINRTCKIRFKSTFEAVDQKLREIFPLLFEGGEAWLSLTDDTDPLDSGVEIHVHPPGKKLTVMSLLSGGEKALVALALIFALYLIKPSPFCLLDETDAPLDEANIDRFNRLLKRLGQSSQIILVTHNKRTMQISETLYGVTMEEPGISKMVSVNLSEFEAMEENEKLVQAG